MYRNKSKGEILYLPISVGGDSASSFMFTLKLTLSWFFLLCSIPTIISGSFSVLLLPVKGKMSVLLMVDRFLVDNIGIVLTPSLLFRAVTDLRSYKKNYTVDVIRGCNTYHTILLLMIEHLDCPLSKFRDLKTSCKLFWVSSSCGKMRLVRCVHPSQRVMEDSS